MLFHNMSPSSTTGNPSAVLTQYFTEGAGLQLRMRKRNRIRRGWSGEFLQQIKDELVSNTYRPMRVRKKEIPKDGGKVRTLSIPSILDPSYRALAFALVRLFLTEYAGLPWAHQHAGLSRRTPSNAKIRN